MLLWCATNLGLSCQKTGFVIVTEISPCKGSHHASFLIAEQETVCCFCETADKAAVSIG